MQSRGDERPSLDKLFSPDSIALVGVSEDPSKLSGRPYKFLKQFGYDGDIFLVNPSHDAIDGEPCYDSVTEIPEPVDFAQVLVPAHLTLQIIAECGEADIPFAQIVAGGFGESGEAGEDLEARLVETAREGGVRFIGPNCQGLLNAREGFTPTFSTIVERDELIPGHVSFVAQSGVFGGAPFQYTQDLGIGTSKFVSTGNEADLSTVDFIEYLIDDPTTQLIYTYIEQLQHGEQIVELGEWAAENDTEIVAIRTGRTERGKSAAASHTGGIATDDEIYQDVFRQAGITQVETMSEAMETLKSYSLCPPSSYHPIDVSGEKGFGVLSASGGSAAMLADASERYGLPLATLPDDLQEKIGEHVPEYGSTANPVDVTGAVISNPGLLGPILELMADSENVTGLVLQLANSGPKGIGKFEQQLFDIREASNVPIAVSFLGGIPTEEKQSQLRENGLLVFTDPVDTVKTLTKYVARSSYLSALERRGPTPSAPASRESLDETWDGVKAALAASDVPFASTETVASPDAAVEAANELGYPVVVKLNPIEFPHKQDLNGVVTGVADDEGVREAFAELSAIDGGSDLLVQETVEGTELIVGVIDDPDFGPVMLFGPGGVFVEILDDFVYRALPVTESEALEMIAETKADVLLDGYRGGPVGDRQALAELMADISSMYRSYSIRELEFNPILVNEDGAVPVDVLVK